MLDRIEEWYAAGGRVPVHLGDGAEVQVWAKAVGRGGPVTLFLHGFPTCSLDWLWVEDELRGAHVAGTRVYVDLVGFGRSDKPRRAYTFDDQVRVVAAVGKRFDIEAADLVVHDYSVSLAMELLARHEAGKTVGPTPHSVLFLNGGLFPGHYHPLPIQRLLTLPLLGPWVARLASFRTFAASMTRIASDEHPPTRGELEALWQLMNERGGMAAIHRLSRYHRERRAEADRWTSTLETTQVPLRFAWGAQDPISGAMVEPIRHHVPGAELTIWQDVGHYPQLEVPVRVAACVAP